jgi:hypothetical protein
MPRFVFFAAAAVVAGGWLAAAPVPQPPTALVAGLSDPATKVRNEAAAALKNRVDALPWLRKAARAADKDTARRAADLLAPDEKQRQEVVAKAIDVCVRDGRIDLLTEWHQYWKPAKEEDLWPVGQRAAKAGMDLLAKSCSKEGWGRVEKRLALQASLKTSSHNGPYPDRFESFKGAWLIRTDRLDGRAHESEIINFASVGGPAKLSRADGRYLVLGPVEGSIDYAFVACDGGIGDRNGVLRARDSVVVCRSNVTAVMVIDSVLLVDGDIDLTRAGEDGGIRNSLIRATGEIRMPKGRKPENCTIEARVKDATSPYKFFELADVGLSVVAAKEGVVVAGVKPDTPFGNSGLQKGDIIRAIDDAPAGHSELFRKQVRRAMVVQGDCLLTVARGDKTLDLAVHFPLPK